MSDIALGGYAPAAGGLTDRLREMVKRGLVVLATVLTNAGVSIVVKRVLQTATAPKYMTWGTGTNAAAVGDTALQTEVAPSGGRQAATESQVTTTVTGDTYQIVATLTATGSIACTEMGALDATSTGNLLLRSVFSVDNLSAAESIQFTSGVKFLAG